MYANIRYYCPSPRWWERILQLNGLTCNTENEQNVAIARRGETDSNGIAGIKQALIICASKNWGENIGASNLSAINEPSVIKRCGECTFPLYIIPLRLIYWYGKDSEETFISKYFIKVPKDANFFLLSGFVGPRVSATRIFSGIFLTVRFYFTTNAFASIKRAVCSSPLVHDSLYVNRCR